MPSDKAINDMSQYFDQASMVVKIQLDSAVQKATMDLKTLIQTMRASGASDTAIRQVLVSDLENSGRIFGAFRNQVKATGTYSVGKMASFGTRYEYEKEDIREFKWQTVGTNICPDCKDRHGQVMTMDQWELSGLPKSGFSVCGTNCKCEVVPVGAWVKDQMKVPIDEPDVLSMASAGKHKSVKDSLAWIKANIADEVQLGSIKQLDVMNAITKGMGDIYSKYNMTRLARVGFSRKKNGALASANARTLNINQSAFTKKKLTEQYDRMNKDFVKQSEDTIAFYKKNLQWLKDNNKPDVNGYYQRQLDKFIKQRDERKKYKRFGASIAGREKWQKLATSTMHHELGHVFHDQSTRFINFRRRTFQSERFRSMMDTEVKSWNDRWRDIFHQVKQSDVKYQISEYAMTEPAELFAETFAMYNGGEKNKVPKIVADYMDDYIRKFGT